MVIIAVSYDPESLNKRLALLQRLRHVVIPSSSLDSCRQAIQSSEYHLLLIGATVPEKDRQALAKISKSLHPISKIISVESAGSLPLKPANRHVAAGGEYALAIAISSITSGDFESEIEQHRR